MELVHGGDWAGYRARFGHDALDFSANVSPLGLPQGVEIGSAQKIERLFNGGGQTARIGLRDMSKNHDLSPHNAWILAHTLSSTVMPLRRFSASRVVNSWPGKRMA